MVGGSWWPPAMVHTPRFVERVVHVINVVKVVKGGWRRLPVSRGWGACVGMRLWLWGVGVNVCGVRARVGGGGAGGGGCCRGVGQGGRLT